MSWIEWLQEFAERGTDGESPLRVRLARTGGNTYSGEWKKVLEDSSRNFDPADTYVWALGGNSSPVMQNRVSVDGMPTPGKPSPDTVAPDAASAGCNVTGDPGGLGTDRHTPKEQGFGPDDTGIFDPYWTGDLDRR